MKSRYLAALVVALLLAVAGCGATHTTTAFRTPSAITPTVQAAPCDPAPGKGTMGACTPAEASGLKLSAPTSRTAVLIPDVSEFQPCALYSEAIFRVYEAGTGREDTRALCHAQALQARHAWYAVYAFLRPGHGGCVYQANRTIAIVRHIGGVVGPIIADAEVWLPAGFVTCFVHALQAHGYVTLIYTAPGTWPGGAFAVRVWVAAYPYRPPCFSNACPYLAHQFSDAVNCRGVFGDCSVNEGILAIRQHAAPKYHNASAEHKHLKALDIERHQVRVHLLNAGCRVKHPRRACQPLFKRGAAVNREIRLLKSRGVK